MALIGNIEQINSKETEISSYFERLEQLFKCNDINTEVKRVSLLITLIGGEAYGVLKDLVAPVLPSEKKYVELVEELKKHYSSKKLIIAERYRFHTAHQEEHEDIRSFVARLKKIAKFCDFSTFLDDSLRDRLVCGLKSESIKQRLLTEESLTFEKAYTTAIGMELAEGQLKVMGPEFGEVNKVFHKSFHKKPSLVASNTHKTMSGGESNIQSNHFHGPKKQKCTRCSRIHVNNNGDDRRVAKVSERHVRMARPRESAAPPVEPHPQSALLTLPPCLRLADSPLDGTGVFAAAPLPRGLCMGPYEGGLVRLDDADGADGGYSWRVRHGRLVDTGVEGHSEWMRFVNCAPGAARQNLAGFQHRGALYFHTVAPVAVGEELFIYYGDNYARNVDVHGYYDYRPPKEAPEPEPGDARGIGGDYAGDTGGRWDPPKEELEPEPEVCGGDEDAASDYISVDRYSDCGSPKLEPESEFAAMDGSGGNGGGADDDYARYISVDVDDYDCHSPKMEPEPEIAATGDGGGDDDCDPLKPEPEPEIAATGDEAVTDGDRDVSVDCSYRGRCCPICGKGFKRKQCLDSHLLKQHSDDSDEVSKLITSKVYTCNICDKYKSVKKAMLKEHISITHLKGVRCQMYQCPSCSYSTFRKKNLTKHFKSHVEQKDYQCTLCKKQFIQKIQLHAHILCNHSDNADLMKTITSKIHRCESCSFVTIRKSRLEKHIKTHLIC